MDGKKLIFGIIFLIFLAIGIFFGYSEQRNRGVLEETYCLEEDRFGDFCIEVYEPVCGFNSEGEVIKTYSNSCFSCLDENVEYWISGEC